VADAARAVASVAPEDFYTRWGNPTTRDLEDTVARLEGGHAAVATSSGMAAVASVLLTAVKAGGRIVATRPLYGGTMALLQEWLPRFRIRCTFVDPARPGAWRAVRKGTDIVLIETPANPSLVLTDLREAVAAARAVGAVTVCDNTFATPVNQRPREHGVDIVLHSATKYLGGHSDVVAGAVVLPDATWHRRLWDTVRLLGPVLGPVEAFLVRRGLKTLDVRVRRTNETARALAEFLEGRREVSAVSYPGLPSFPQRSLFKRQMRGGGGMVAFELRGGREAARRFVESVRLASLAVSLGGCETLVEHPASMTHGAVPRAERQASGIRDGLVRVSVGLEAYEDLRHDFAAALRKA
jgi:cystathionine beta-lyase/cystathionine gamma-synthase